MVVRGFIAVEGSLFEAVLFEDEDGWWVREIPQLAGCISQGRTYTEAVENITDAARGLLEARGERAW